MLHETTQRRVCRIAFLAGCVLPTVLVLAAVAQFWLPGYSRRWETPLGQLLDCRVSIQGIHTPTPGKSDFERIEFSDLEVGAKLAVLNGVAVAVHEGKTRISARDAEVFVSEGVGLEKCFERFLRCHERDEVIVSFTKLVLSSTSESLSLSDVRAHFASDESGSRVQFWSPEDVASPRLMIERNRQLNPPATRVTFDTGSIPISCELLSAWDGFDQLGAQASFQGQIELTSSRESVRGQLSGNFASLRPSPIVAPSNFPTELLVKELRWSSGRPTSVNAMPTSPVAAILTQFAAVERSSAEQSAGDVTWELTPRAGREEIGLQSWR